MDFAKLTRYDATFRSENLVIDSYDLRFDLREATTSSTFPVDVAVTVTSKSDSIFLDYLGESVEHVMVDGVPVPWEQKGARIVLDVPTNQPVNITIRSHSYYSRSGQGLHRFTDPEDGQTYLYSHSEPSDARRIFPCFDQPDLKARVTVNMLVPDGWVALSNHMGTTPPISTYLLAFAAGPYVGRRDVWRNIDLGVWTRTSMAEYVDDEIMEVTKQGLEFFDQHFGFPYPWGKYDSIFVPEYNLGAMENPGLVTFKEEYIFRFPATDAERAARANTILHEMSHMWFGDLVTPLWWDDLWLKESFAEFMGADAATHATRFTNAWADFAGERKNWAYMQDQLPTTHPIKAEIPDVDAARQNFDGITYTKGAAVLKQLVHFVGRDNFYAAAREYFRAHAFSVATFDDLITALSHHTDQDLHDWSDRWLRTTGVDQLTPVLEVADGVIQRLTITQEGVPLARPHRITVSLFRQAERTHSFDVFLPGDGATVTAAEGLPAPDLVLLNDGDHTYAKIGFDERSLDTIHAHLSDITDEVSRAVIWTALWNLTRDAQLPARDYIRTVLTHGPAETNPTIAEQVFNTAQLAATRFSNNAELLADGLWVALHRADPGSDMHLLLTRATIAALAADRQPESIIKLRSLLDEDQDIRWRIMAALASHDATPDLEAERERDNTLTGHAAYLRAQYSYPGAKAAAFEELLDAMRYSNAEITAIIAGFRAPADTEPDFSAEFRTHLHHMWDDYPIEIANRIIRGLYPTAGMELPDEELPDALRRILLECEDHVQRQLTAFNNQ